jgi:hypothetical protein
MQAWWCKSVILTPWEVEMGGLSSEASQGKSTRPYLKKQTRKQKDWGALPKGRALQYHKKKKKKKKREET